MKSLGSGGKVYVGIDLENGAPGSPSATFSIAAVDSEGRFRFKQEKVQLPRLVRITWELRPVALAVDNVFELGRSVQDLIRVLSMLPPELNVIQVTIVNGRFEDLKEVAKSAGIKVEGGRLTPSKTAYLAALLASKGIGTPIRLVEEKTVISVSRGRSGSPGGWSQQRFQRKARAAVAGAVNSLRDALESEGLDYDLHYRRSEGGIDSAVFTVYAPYTRVHEIVRRVKPSISRDVTVKIKPIYRSKLLIGSQHEGGTRKPLLIVGIDPGVTTGLAIMDVDGNLIYYTSSKNLDRSRITEIVVKYGTPIAVAVDVSDPPETARRLASQWRAVLYTPPQDLAPHEKRHLAEKAAGKVDDSHARDAIAAAVKAYQYFRSKLENIERYVEKLGIDVDTDVIKSEVLRGASLAEALERFIARRLEEDKVSEESRGSDRARQNTTPNVSHYVEALEALKLEKARLERENRALLRRIDELKLEIERLRRAAYTEATRDRIISSLKYQVESLQSRVNELERMLEERGSAVERLKETLAKVASGRLRPVRLVERLTITGLRESAKIYGELREGEIIYVRECSNFTRDAVEAIASKKPLGAIVKCGSDSPLARALEARRIPVVTSAQARIVEVEGIALADPQIESLIAERRRVMEEVRAAKLDLARLVREYRESRRSSLGKRGK